MYKKAQVVRLALEASQCVCTCSPFYCSPFGGDMAA